jgi:hypothetical protein
MNLFHIFKPVVFEWLDVIEGGTNKEVVDQLLTPKGISYTFDLSPSLAKALFKSWKSKKTKKQNHEQQ